MNIHIYFIINKTRSVYKGIPKKNAYFFRKISFVSICFRKIFYHITSKIIVLFPVLHHSAGRNKDFHPHNWRTFCRSATESASLLSLCRDWKYLQRWCRPQDMQIVRRIYSFYYHEQDTNLFLSVLLRTSYIWYRPKSETKKTELFLQIFSFSYP